MKIPKNLIFAFMGLIIVLLMTSVLIKSNPDTTSHVIKNPRVKYQNEERDQWQETTLELLDIIEKQKLQYQELEKECKK